MVPGIRLLESVSSSDWWVTYFLGYVRSVVEISSILTLIICVEFNDKSDSWNCQRGHEMWGGNETYGTVTGPNAGIPSSGTNTVSSWV